MCRVHVVQIFQMVTGCGSDTSVGRPQMEFRSARARGAYTAFQGVDLTFFAAVWRHVVRFPSGLKLRARRSNLFSMHETRRSSRLTTDCSAAWDQRRDCLLTSVYYPTNGYIRDERERQWGPKCICMGSRDLLRPWAKKCIVIDEK